MDYISRETAKHDIVAWARVITQPDLLSRDDALTALDCIPAADVRPVVWGENVSDKNPVDEFICSECGLIMRDLSEVYIDEEADGDESFLEFEFKFCPKCGAKIKEEPMTDCIRMREILFRGRRTDNAKWVEGSYCFAEKLDRSGGEHLIVEYVANGFACEVDPSTVGQYIGLQDKHGKKIFEGDIVHVYDATGYCIDFEFEGGVVYRDASFAIQSEDMTHYRWIDYEVEVIGNVHDGKEQDNG